MGIHGFYYKWLRRHYQLKYKALLENLPPGKVVSSLLLDFNGIIHRTAGQVYASADERDKKLLKRNDPEAYDQLARRIRYLNSEAGGRMQQSKAKFNEFLKELEQEHFQLIGHKLLDVVTRLHPQDLLIVSVDGPAPLAKLKQQRSRRYLAAKTREEMTEKNKDGDWPWKVNYPWPLFNSSSITPGTDFMIRLDKFLKEWLEDNGSLLPPHIIYYSHLVPGEGEHRIMDDFRSGRIQDLSSNPAGLHIIYSSDSDLAMLGLIAQNRVTDKMIPNIFIARDNLEDIISIDNFRLAIKEIMSTKESAGQQKNTRGGFQQRGGRSNRQGLKLKSPVPDKTWWSDFIVLFFLAGNDFLPRPSTLDDLLTGIDDLIGIYQQNLQYTGYTLTQADGQINWRGIYALFDSLGQFEPELLNRLAQDETRRFPNTSLQRATSHKQIPSMVGLKSKTQRQAMVNVGVYRSHWYSRILLPQTPEQTDLERSLFPQNVAISLDSIIQMVQEYLKGIGWVNLYYQYGQAYVNLDWFYPWEYAPLFIDIRAVSFQSLAEGKSPVDYQAVEDQLSVNVVDQLLAVLPPQFKDLLPASVRNLVSGQSPLVDLYPVNFKSDLDGKTAEWQAIPLLPMFQPDRIRAQTGDMNFSKVAQKKYDLAGEVGEWYRQNPDSPYVEGGHMHGYVPKASMTRGRQESSRGYRGSSRGYRGSSRGHRGSNRGYQESSRGHRGSSRGYQESSRGHRGSSRGQSQQLRPPNTEGGARSRPNSKPGIGSGTSKSTASSSTLSASASTTKSGQDHDSSSVLTRVKPRRRPLAGPLVTARMPTRRGTGRKYASRSVASVLAQQADNEESN